ncbi:MAG: hypothetical protein K9M99_12375 [Candidatus Cloacimonetes bacterium]|nr:hypothetical protein [Candidatus Cloacimonadota bacterium]
MIIIKAVLHFLCVVIAGRRLFIETGSSKGYLAGLFLGPFGILLVNFAPGLLLKRNEKKRNDNWDPLMDEISSAPDRLDKLKQQKIGSGFQVSRMYMPITGGYFISLLLGTLYYTFYVFFPVLSLTFKAMDVFPTASSELIYTIPAVLIFFIPMVMGLMNFRTMIICPRCGTTHTIYSRLETLLGYRSDPDPRETGCRACDYLPSRDRVITVE